MIAWFNTRSSVNLTGKERIQLRWITTDSKSFRQNNECIICDLLCENRPFQHIWYFEKYHFEILKPLQFSCAMF